MAFVSLGDTFGLLLKKNRSLLPDSNDPLLLLFLKFALSFLSGLIFFVVVHRDVVYEELTYDDNACSDYNIVT